jgi:UDP-N-acetylglucosamine 4-epimerase
MISYVKIQKNLLNAPRTWAVTGVAGFIGSNILEELLKLNQKVVGIDNFSTGFRDNLEDVRSEVTIEQWKNFSLIEEDICYLKNSENTLKDVDYLLHQAALGSVPRSIKDPIASNLSNVSGFLNVLYLSKEKNIPLTYASSSSVYGDHPDLPKVENKTGNPLSTYALTKHINELYSRVFSLNYDHASIGLRYFNVYGKRQNPNGEYAAVIPKWVSLMCNNREINIYGDGSTSRDFCFVDNVVQMNILSSVRGDASSNRIYNVACGESTSLNQLYSYLKEILNKSGIKYSLKPEYKEFREGDVKHSLANISRGSEELGYFPQYDIKEGLAIAVPWLINKFKN